MSHTVVSSTDSNLDTKRVAPKRFTQAVAESIMAGLEKLQARLDEITTKLDGKKKDVSDRRDMMMKRDVSTSAAEAEELTKESMVRKGFGSMRREPVTVRQHEGQFALNVV